jgi:hypothetical protein
MFPASATPLNVPEGEPVAPSTIYAPLVDSVAVMVPLPEKPAANPSAATPVKVKSKVSSTGLLWPEP